MFTRNRKSSLSFFLSLLLLVLWRQAIESGYWAMTPNGRRKRFQRSKLYLSSCRVAGRDVVLHKQPLCIDRNSILPSHFSPEKETYFMEEVGIIMQDVSFKQ